MSVKGSWPRGKSSSYCIKDCANRDVKCDDCYKYDMFIDLAKSNEPEVAGCFRPYIGG